MSDTSIILLKDVEEEPTYTTEKFSVWISPKSRKASISAKGSKVAYTLTYNTYLIPGLTTEELADAKKFLKKSKRNKR